MKPRKYPLPAQASRTMMQVATHTFPNGVRVACATMPQFESVTLGIWIGFGSRYEEPQLAGVSHFIEHLLFKGTPSRSSSAISFEIEGHGGYLDAFTQEENTCFHARVARDRVWETLDVLCDMYANSLCKPSDIARERDVILDEIVSCREQPQTHVQELLTSALWPDHPAGRSIVGTEQSLAKLNRRSIVDTWQRAYVPANTVFAFAGNITLDECKKRLAPRIANRQARPAPQFNTVPDSCIPVPLVAQDRDCEQTHFNWACRLFGRNDERRYAVRVLNTVLGENMSSRLFQSIREEHGLAYAVGSYLHVLEETGALVVSASVDHKDLLPCLRLLSAEIRRLKSRLIPREELERAKDYVTVQTRLGLESTTSQMMWIGENILAYDRFTSPEEAIHSVNTLSSENLRTLVRQSFSSNCISLALVGPKRSRRETAKILAVARDV